MIITAARTGLHTWIYEGLILCLISVKYKQRLKGRLKKVPEVIIYIHGICFKKVNVSLDSISIVSWSSKPKSDAHCDFSALFFSIKFAPEVNVSLAGCGSNKRLRLFLFSLFFFCDNPFFRDLVEGI